MTKHLAIVGATGAVGGEALALITQRHLALDRISAFASQRSAGRSLRIGSSDCVVQELTQQSFRGIDYAIFCAGAKRSHAFVPAAVSSGCVVIDNSSAFRMDETVPLVVPEINSGDAFDHHGIIANPNCSTIVMNLAVWPLHVANPIKRILVSTYQSASGAGAAAMEELRSQSMDVLNGKEVRPEVFPHPIAFNVFSHDTPLGPDGYNTEERKMIDETRKIFHEPSLSISATCVRVPVFRAHSESINLTFQRSMNPDTVRDILSTAPGIRVVDDVQQGRFPMPLEASGGDDVLVGRIRQDASQADGRGIEMFVSGDQLRKGAALNAIQILELLMR